ncbi:unnamed protein product [Eruca vesicaria subsp. sativa]|uniref:Uncharacterized protein n=1 Tax=Eruca vesicaria subsp. sativa TaxID=29727 RepID=A0ABC8L9W7_ERUVS|nr:unnamed protein product [Eruca vesicaria subsp. sativa]
MDLSTVAAEELAPPTQPHRLSTSCDVHPEERFSGFCPSCLCERLSVLDHNGAPPQQPSSSSFSRKPPTISTAALKALFKPSTSNANGNGRVRAGFFPELRRSKSFSAKNNEGICGGIEPQRRSCDVRLREENRNLSSSKEAGKMEEEEVRKSSVSEAVVEEVTEEVETEEEESSEIVNDDWVGEIREEKREEEVKRSVEEMKPMKEYMDLYPHTKKPSVRDFAGSFFSAASVFSKKLQKWRHKQQKIKKPRGGQVGGRPQLAVDRRQPRERDTQSEIAGRRSSDTDPRFSLDAGRFSVDIGRISVDDSRYSLDEPRASWDGHLIGRNTTLPPTARVPPPPSMLSVVENAPMQAPVEDPSINGESDPIIIIPGGSTQTRDYYTEPPSRRRKSLDRSNSIKKAMEMEDVKSVVSNSRVSPAITAAEPYSSIENNNNNKVNENGDKKSRRWGKWSMLGFIYRKGVSSKGEDDEEDRYSRSNSTGMVERSLSESWPELRNEGGGPKMRRSNSNVSWRSSGGGGSSRNKSWRNSSKDGGDNGMLRFYLTPSWRNGNGGGGGGASGWEKTAARANSHGHSIARRVMRLY